jgi:hypothetical protein
LEFSIASIRLDSEVEAIRLSDIIDKDLSFNKEALSLYILENKKPQSIKDIFADVANFVALCGLKKGPVYRDFIAQEGKEQAC